jgi:hypothetical protein
MEWTRNSIYTPPDAWFHQHFNIGAEPCRHIAVYAPPLPLGHQPRKEENTWQGFESISQGGTLIEYHEEDPQIRLDYQTELGNRGLTLEMPPVTYRA